MKPIVAEGLTAGYDRNTALWEVSFEIEEGGSLVAIIGPNGAGKSTLLKALLGMASVSSGSVSILGKAPSKARGQVAYVPQRSEVDWNFPINVLDVVLMGSYKRLGLFSWPGKKERGEAFECLERVGMLPSAQKQISELSGGQQQRVFIARALMQKAPIYFMDEPFAGVDMATEAALFSLFADLKKEGKTLCIVHHDLSSVQRYFDTALLLNRCLIDAGPVAQVLNEKNLTRAYGNSVHMLAEAWKLALAKSKGE